MILNQSPDDPDPTTPPAAPAPKNNFATGQALDPGKQGSAAYYGNTPTIDPHINELTQGYIKSNNLQANQSDPASLNKITDYLRSQGVNAQTDYTDSNNHTGGIVVNGKPYQLMDGSNNWTSLQPWEEEAPAGGGGVAGPPSQIGGAGGAGGSSGIDAINGFVNQGQADSGNLIMQLLAKLHGQTGSYKG